MKNTRGRLSARRLTALRTRLDKNGPVHNGDRAQASQVKMSIAEIPFNREKTKK